MSRLGSGADREPTAQRAATVARDRLERLMVELRSLPADVDRGPLFAAVEAGLAQLERLLALPLHARDYLDHYDGASGGIRAVARELDLVGGTQAARLAERVLAVAERLGDHREAVLDEMVIAQEQVEQAPEPGAPPDAPEAPLGLRASVGTPQLHTLPNARYAPLLDARAGRAAAAAPGAAQLGELARECLAEMGCMGRLRNLTDDRPWSPAVASFEQRLLNNLDALWSIARECSLPSASAEGRPAAAEAADEEALLSHWDVLDELARFSRENPMDEDRAFVRSLVLGCLSGEEAVRAAVMGLRRAQAHTLPAHARGLSLAPNAAIRPAMEKPCLDEDPRLVRLGLDVLRLRREASFAAVAMLLSHSDVAVRRSAVLTLPTTGDREPAVQLLIAALDDELDGTVTAAGAEALCRLDHPQGLVIARERLLEEQEIPGSLANRARATFIRLLAVAGAPPDLDLLLAVVDRPSEVAALGWFGHVGAVEHLLEVLAEPAPPAAFGAVAETRPQAAARALHRITGAVLEPSADSRRQPGARADAVEADPVHWRAWWAEHRTELSAAVKLRHGELFAPEATIGELERDVVPHDVREMLELELALLSGGVHVLQVGDWAPRQAAALAYLRSQFAGWTAQADSRVHAPGEWLARRVGERHAIAAVARTASADP